MPPPFESLRVIREQREREQRERAQRFADLHVSLDLLLLPNAWDAGSAKLLASLGFSGLATTSGGLAGSLGLRDGIGAVSREQALRNAAEIVAATDLPVTADLENGYGETPSDVAETIRAAAQIGLAGASIEDATGNPDDPIYPFDAAVERVAAAAKAARELPHPFILTARAENFLHGRHDLADTIRRLQAYDHAGAHVLYAPLLQHVGQIREIVTCVSKPVNVLRAGALAHAGLGELRAAGARRISVGSSFYHASMAALRDAAIEFRTTS